MQWLTNNQSRVEKSNDTIIAQECTASLGFTISPVQVRTRRIELGIKLENYQKPKNSGRALAKERAMVFAELGSELSECLLAVLGEPSSIPVDRVPETLRGVAHKYKLLGENISKGWAQ